MKTMQNWQAKIAIDRGREKQQQRDRTSEKEWEKCSTSNDDPYIYKAPSLLFFYYSLPLAGFRTIPLFSVHMMWMCLVHSIGSILSAENLMIKVTQFSHGWLVYRWYAFWSSIYWLHRNDFAQHRSHICACTCARIHSINCVHSLFFSSIFRSLLQMNWLHRHLLFLFFPSFYLFHANSTFFLPLATAFSLLPTIAIKRILFH